MAVLKRFIILFTIFIFGICNLEYIFSALPHSYGFGANSTAKGEAVVSNVKDWSAPFYNMAGSTFPSYKNYKYRKQKKFEKERNNIVESITNSISQKKEIKKSKKSKRLKEDKNVLAEFGITYSYQYTRASISPFGITNPNSFSDQAENNMQAATSGLSYGMIQLGFNIDLRTIFNTPFDVPIKIALAMSVRDNGTFVSINDVNLEDYNFLSLGREPQSITVITGLSFQIWKDRLSIGVGGSLALVGSGAFDMTELSIGGQPSQDGNPSNDQPLPRHSIAIDMRANFSPVTGIMYMQPLPNDHALYFGFSFRSESKLELYPLDVQAEVIALSLQIPLTLSVLDFYTPHTFTSGISYTFFNKKNVSFLIGIDYEYQMWSRNPISQSKEQYYQENGTSLTNYRDISIVKVGFQIDVDSIDLSIRGGYQYRQAFTNNQVGVQNTLDNNKHITALGLAYTLVSPDKKKFKADTMFSLGFQFHLHELRYSDKIEPTLLNPSYSYGAYTLVFSLDISFLII